MQTFLPYSSFALSASVLDMRRLGKQRVETWQIYETLTGVKDGWANHPAVRMWEGHEEALGLYGRFICSEWRARGYKDTMLDRFVSIGTPWYRWAKCVPDWLGDPDFHASHQSNLVRKKPDFYGPIFPGVPDDLPYVWPKPTSAA